MLVNQPVLSITLISTMTTQHEPSSPHQSIDGVKHIVAIASGKGGVGKSTIAANVAVALAQSGAQVGLLDADIYGPNAAIMLGLEGETLTSHQGAEVQTLEPNVNHGVKLVSSSFLVPPDRAVMWRGPMLSKLIRRFFADVAWGELDYLIVDLPPGTGDVQLTIAKSFPITGAVIVTTPQKVALADARRGLKMFERLNVPILGVVENMSGEFFGTGAGEILAAQNETEYFGTIPMDANVRLGGDSGSPIVMAYPDSAAAQAFADVASKVAARVSVMTLMNDSSFIPIEMVG